MGLNRLPNGENKVLKMKLQNIKFFKKNIFLKNIIKKRHGRRLRPNTLDIFVYLTHLQP